MGLKKFYISLYILLFYLLSIHSFQQNSSQLRQLKKNKKTFAEQYLELAFEIFKELDKKCHDEIKEMIDEKNIPQSSRKYPWIIDVMGKGLNDLGDEVECTKYLSNTTYILAELLSFNYIYPDEEKLVNFLEIKNYTFGICLMENCKNSFEKYLIKVLQFVNTVSNKTNDDLNENIVHYFDINNKPQSEYKKNIIIIFFIYIAIKLLIGYARLIILPKGYDKHVAENLQKHGKLENIDLEENTSFFQKDTKNEILMNLINEESDTKEYNPKYDLSAYYSIKLKITQFFDLFNDINLLSTKRNRYFNDNGLEIIVFMRAIVIYFLIFSGTFYTLVSIPSIEIFNKTFFNSLLIFFYKISINSLTCWTVLEAAYTIYKLMYFIKAKRYEYYVNNKRYSDIKLVIIYGKFILLFIPKICIFFLIYYFYYYKPEDFTALIKAEKIFNYIIKKVFQKGINVENNPVSLLFSSFFSRNINDYNNLYEFIYLYFNILVCTLLFMILIFFSFLFRSKIFEIIIILLNLVCFFGSIFLIYDDKVYPKNDNEKLEYKYYHLVGQQYSTKVSYCLLGFYHLGVILGFLCFHYDNNKYNFNLNQNEIVNYEQMNKLDKSQTNYNDENVNDNDNESDYKMEINDTSGIRTKSGSTYSKKSFREFNINYYPLSFLNNFLSWLNNIGDTIKIIIILICIIFIIALSLAFQLYINITDPNFEIEFSYTLKIYFLFEKHLFIIFFFIINVILLTLPKNGFLKSLINSNFIIAISRTGFTITCLNYFSHYFSYCFFFIKVKYHIPTFILISIGNYLIIFILCFLFNIVFELPLRIIIKQLLRINKKKL